jgi:predicted AAA+ superfamily ATPase
MTDFSLATQNQWWIDPKKIQEDEQIQRAERSSVRWNPRILYTFNLEQDAVYTLRGPRQVGKTTAIKLIIKKILETGINPRRIFYWTCDLLSNPNELAKLIDTYIKQTNRITDERLYIFLDEVSSIKDWQKGVKYLYDTGALRNCTLVLTGSHSLDLRRAAERLPGRRGVASGPLDKILLPMKYCEYVEALDPGLRKIIIEKDLFHKEHRKEILESLIHGEIPPEIEELNLYSTQLEQLLDNYLITGGIIRSINEYYTKGLIDPNLYQAYLSAVIGDIIRWGKKEVYLAALIRRINDALTSRVSWTALKKDTDISHTDTVADYIDTLESSYTIQVLYNLDSGSGEPQLEKDKKIYFKDPFIYHSLISWVHQEAPYPLSMKSVTGENKAKMIESVVCDHLTRLAYNLNPTTSFEPRRSVFYWASKTRESDFVIKYNDTLLPFEVKYQNSVSGSDYSNLFALSTPEGQNGILVTKHTLDKHRGAIALPVYLFLMLV